jgi:hypothetical protein
MQSLLFNVSPTDPVTFATITALLFAGRTPGMLAARRGARPKSIRWKALRYE